VTAEVLLEQRVAELEALLAAGVHADWARMIAAGPDIGLISDLVADWHRLRRSAGEEGDDRV